MVPVRGAAGIRGATIVAFLFGWASPMRAQLDGPELAGSYPVELRAQGGGCPSLQRTRFEVRSVNRDRLETVLNGSWGTGQLRGLFDGGEREFYLSYRSLDGVAVTGMQGFFERRGGNIGVVIAVNFADGVDCTGEFQGSRRAAAASQSAPPAAPAASATPAAPVAEPGPTRIGPTANAAQPAPASPAAEGEPARRESTGRPGAERPSRVLQVLRVVGLALLGFAVGFGLVRLFGRRRIA